LNARLLDNTAEMRHIRPIIVLDIDDTMLCENSAGVLVIRPYLREFLTRASAQYDLAIWTAGYQSRVSLFLALLGITIAWKFTWSINNCRTYGNQFGIKDLRDIANEDADRTRIILIDDDVEQCIFNERNGFRTIRAPPFDSQASDTFFRDLIP
jgi:TFIIF-interacting CTD phosphatase-like protein